MNAADAIGQVQQGLGWRTDKATEILFALNEAIKEREKPGRTLPWFLVSQDQSLSVLSGVQETTFPTNFIRERESDEPNLRYNSGVAGSRTFFLRKDSVENLDRYFFGDWQNNWDTDSQSAANALSPGLPRAYALRSLTVKIYPIPDANYTLTWDYYAKSTPITAVSSETDNKWLLYEPWVIICDAGLKMAADLQNNTAVQKFMVMAGIKGQALIADTVQRELAGRPLRMGSRL